MPAGTVFCKYKPCYFGSLQMKTQTAEHDFYSIELVAKVYFEKDSSEMFDTLDKAQKDGSSFKLDVDSDCRDGFFENDQLYGIYEKEDIEKLIEKLKEAL